MSNNEERNGTAGADEQVFTANDMLRAFKHGLKFEELDIMNGCEIDCGDFDEKHWPFWEWLKAQNWSV